MTVLAVQEALWWALVFLSLQFIAIGTCLRGERIIPFLGAQILVLCLMVGIDVWILLPALGRKVGDRSVLEAWLLAYQILACAFGLLTFLFLRHLTGRPGTRALRVHTAVLAGWIALGVLDMAVPGILFIGIRDWAWAASPLYSWIFFPYIAGTFAWLIVQAFLRRRQSGPEAEAILNRLCAGFALLLAFGVLDFLVVLGSEVSSIPSQTLFGVLGFNVICTFMLADRLVRLFRANRDALLEMARVQGEMGRQEPLREIGVSAATVSDLIRGDLLRLKQDMSRLDAVAPQVVQAEAGRVEAARSKLERLTEGILEFSRCGVPGERKPVDPMALVGSCFDGRFPAGAVRVRLLTGAPAAPVSVDAAGMARALSELVLNARQAGAASLDVRIRQGLGRTVLAFEDDGRGIPKGRLEDIVQPFFTTRRAEGGVGLGASIASGIIRGHGGTLCYRGNRGRAGLTAVVVLPLAVPAAPGEPAECVLLSRDGDRVAELVSACESLGVRPLVTDGLGTPPAGWRRGVVAGAAPGSAEACAEEEVLGSLVAARATQGRL